MLVASSVFLGKTEKPEYAAGRARKGRAHLTSQFELLCRASVGFQGALPYMQLAWRPVRALVIVLCCCGWPHVWVQEPAGGTGRALKKPYQQVLSVFASCSP